MLSPIFGHGHHEAASQFIGRGQIVGNRAAGPHSIWFCSSPTCWRAYRISPPSAFTNSCPGTGVLRASLTLLERYQPSAQNQLTRGRRRMRSESVRITLKLAQRCIQPAHVIAAAASSQKKSATVMLACLARLPHIHRIVQP